MSKYLPLWVYLKKHGQETYQLTFEQMQEILGFPVDHSLLNYKKEALGYGYEIVKISLKNKVTLIKTYKEAPMDIWKSLYDLAKKQYHPEEISNNLITHSRVCAIEASNGNIYTGFDLIELDTNKIINAEIVATLNMYVNSGITKIKRLLVFEDKPPCGEKTNLPTKESIDFIIKLNQFNSDLEVLIDYKKRVTKRLKSIISKQK